MSIGFYTAAAGMLTQQRTINVLANNLLNHDTPGFRSERVVTTTFEQEMLTRIENGNTAVIGRGSPLRIMDQVVSDFGSGILEQTDRPFDFAINGEGYFAIQGTDNVYLTRNGNFKLDGEGYLELEGIGRVLGKNGEIYIGSSDFDVTSDGYIYDGYGNRVNRLFIVSAQQAEGLQRTENGLYIAEEALDFGEANMPEGTEIMQYFLEKSNVNINRELSLIMEAQRNFQALSKILQGMDEINRKSATQIASLG
jgi:flagellar basal-body rod protein FlgF